ncbi:MAG: helix-turn-helix domain-containing protein [Bacilli bacterium]
MEKTFNKGVFGGRILELRKKLKLSQDEFAKKTSISTQSISKYELGENVPGIDTVFKIANACNVSIDWLCGKEEKNSRIEQDISNDEEALRTIVKLGNYYGESFNFLFSDGHHCLSENEINRYKDFDKNKMEIVFYIEDSYVTQFFKEYMKLKELKDTGVINQDMFDTWVYSRIKDITKPIDMSDLPF